MLDWLDSQGVSSQDWILELPVQAEELRKPASRVSWPIFLTLCTRLSEVAPGALSSRQIGAKLGERAFATADLRVLASDCEPKDLFSTHAGRVADALFEGLRHHVEKLSGERTALHLDLPGADGESENQDGRAFFELAAGLLETAPALLDAPPAQVEAKVARRSARYILRVPSANDDRADLVERSSPAAILQAQPGSENDQRHSDRLRSLVEDVDEVKPLRGRLEQYAGTETVLVVEDSDSVRQLVERYLKRLGYQVLCATESTEALAHCVNHKGPIQLLLTDVVLPKMSGVEITQRVREIRRDIRVIYMSGFSGNLVDAAHELEPDFFLLEKPFTPSTLLRAVRECLDMRGKALRADSTPVE